MNIKGNQVKLTNVLYVPSLSNSLFSVKVHTITDGCQVHMDKSLATIAFPTFIETVPMSEEIEFKFTQATTTIKNVKPTIPTTLQHVPIHNSKSKLYYKKICRPF